MIERLRLIICATLVVGAFSCGRSQNTPPEWRLVETSAVALPPSFVITGAIRDREDILLWSAPAAAIMVISNSRIKATLDNVQLGRATMLLAVAPTGRGLEVIDRSGRIGTYTWGGSVDFQSLSLGERVQLIAAVHEDSGWTLAVLADSALKILALRCSSGQRMGDRCTHWGTHVVATLRDPTRRSQNAHVTALANRTIVTYTSAPFSAAIIDSAGNVTTFEEVHAPSPSRVAPTPREEPLWASLPLLPVGSLFVQTLTDLRSDHRVLVLRDSSGAVIRQTALEAPLGMIGSSKELAEMYAARAANRNELVVYRLCGGGASPCQPR